VQAIFDAPMGAHGMQDAGASAGTRHCPSVRPYSAA
jgi:hypothetical protein